MERSALIDPDAALDMILSGTPKLGVEAVPLSDAIGRVLAEDISTDEDLPPFDNSAMDGYAVAAEDTRGASREDPRALRILAEAPAGTVVSQAVVPGTAVRIMTGAPVPAGADAVVMVEDTECSDGEVRIYREASPGAHIRRSGEDVRRGERVLRQGAYIRPAEMGMLAAVGRAEVAVYRRPKVAVITSGDELVDVSERPGPGQIRDANQYSLLGQVLCTGAEVSMLKRVTDEKEELERVLGTAAHVSDMVIVSGGVSVGDYDFVKETLAKLGDIRFWKVAIKPGKPFAYGCMEGKPLFGLPGNPVSSMVTFDLFVRPAIRRMMGLEGVAYTMVSAVVTRDIRHRPGRREFIRAMTVWEDGAYSATPAAKQGSGVLSSMLCANSYIVIPEGAGDTAAGECLDIMLFE